MGWPTQNDCCHLIQKLAADPNTTSERTQAELRAIAAHANLLAAQLEGVWKEADVRVWKDRHDQPHP